MIFEDLKLCYDLLMVQLDNGVIDLSWCLDTDYIRSILKEKDIQKVLTFNESVDFLVQIDNVNTFDSINLKEYKFSELEKTYSGKIVYSAIIDNFYKNKLEETKYFFRVKFIQKNKVYQGYYSDKFFLEKIELLDSWSDTCEFVIRKNFTKDIIDIMYNFVADENAYNKEAKSANFYYIFQAFADTINKQYNYILDEKNSNFIDKSLPDFLQSKFGYIFNFTNTEKISMEEYRRILKNLIIAYQNGGSWKYLKNTLKYIFGYTPELISFNEFYSWILRDNTIQEPEDFSLRMYSNPITNFYLFKDKFDQIKNNNQIMLLKDGFRKFTFVIKCDNFFNSKEIDSLKAIELTNILKSSYEKYNLSIDKYEEPLEYENLLLTNDDYALLAKEDIYLKYE